MIVKMMLMLMSMVSTIAYANAVQQMPVRAALPSGSVWAQSQGNALKQFDGVQRNRKVLAIAQTENIEIQRPMHALSYGRVGQTIRVFDPNTLAIHQALVISNEVVQLQWKGLTSQ